MYEVRSVFKSYQTIKKKKDWFFALSYYVYTGKRYNSILTCCVFAIFDDNDHELLKTGTFYIALTDGELRNDTHVVVLTGSVLELFIICFVSVIRKKHFIGRRSTGVLSWSGVPESYQCVYPAGKDSETS